MNVNDVLKLNDSIMEAWNRHDTEKFLSLCDENIVRKDTSSPQPTKGKQGAKEFFNKWVTAFPDFKMKLVNTVATEDSVACEIEFSGTNTGRLKISDEVPEIPATNKKVTNA